MAPLRASLARSPPRLGRSQAGGLHPQTPRAAPPGAPSRTGPLLPRSPSRRGFRARVRRWRGWATACGCPCPTPSPWRFSGFWRNSKRGQCEALRGDSGGVPPGVVERWATRVRAVGGQGSTRSVVPAVHGPQRCPRRNGPQGAAVEAVWLFLTLRTTYRVRSSKPQSRAKPRSERKNKEGERKL